MATLIETPRGKWKARVRKFGVPEQSKTFKRKTDAEAWARQIESQIERGVWRDTSEADRTSLRAALDRYEREVTPKKRGGQDTEKSNLRLLRGERIAALAIGRLASSDLARLRDHWTREGLKPSTIRRRMVTLSHVFTIASKEWGMTSLVNPVRNVRLAPENNARDRRVSEREIEAICASSGRSSALGSFVRLAVETAARRSELTNLCWHDVHLIDRTIHLEKTKSGKPRDVPLSPVAIEILRKLRKRGTRGEDKVLSWARGDSATQAFNRARDRARKTYLAKCETSGKAPDTSFLENLHLHDLRHEATSRLASLFAIHELTKITGHSDTKMLLRYYHPLATDLANRFLQVKRMRPRRDSNARPAA